MKLVLIVISLALIIVAVFPLNLFVVKIIGAQINNVIMILNVPLMNIVSKQLLIEYVLPKKILVQVIVIALLLPLFV